MRLKQLFLSFKMDSVKMETRDEEVEVIQTAEEELEVPTVAETTEQQQPIGGEIGGDAIKVSKDQIMRMMTEINQLKESFSVDSNEQSSQQNL